MPLLEANFLEKRLDHDLEAAARNQHDPWLLHEIADVQSIIKRMQEEAVGYQEDVKRQGVEHGMGPPHLHVFVGFLGGTTQTPAQVDEGVAAEVALAARGFEKLGQPTAFQLWRIASSGAPTSPTSRGP